ncbi:MAG: T9SS type A sorting domain-containing protein [Candidatus Cloacimonetes bacterium]|nr:T9SS type A sorting domain-containing protein [Candidatus Cloacimonadota bacterium]
MMKFTMLLGSNLGGQVDSGTFYFVNGDGDRFSGNSGFSDDQTFVALQFIFGANGAITLRYRRTGVWTTINSTPVAQSSVLDFELFGNNSAQTVSYTYAGSSYSVAAGKFDMWINGSIYGDELLKSRLADGANIDSFMFYGDASDGNVANLFLDNITYQNSLEPDETLPVELTSFTAVTTPQNLVRLDWITQSESGISGYYVYRNSVDRIMDAQIVSPLILPTNTTTEHAYTFTDNEVQSGTWYYWLQHLELGGYEAFHGPVYVLLNNNIDNGIPGIPQLTGLQSIYPNPFNPSTTIAFGLAKSDRVSIAVFNSRGQKVRDFDSIDLPSGNYTSVWNGTDNNGRILSSGVYTIRLKTGADSHVRKVVMLK